MSKYQHILFLKLCVCGIHTALKGIKMKSLCFDICSNVYTKDSLHFKGTSESNIFGGYQNMPKK